MKKNITLVADEDLLQRAREKARQENQSLNLLFQHWLNQYVQEDRTQDTYEQLMERLSYAEAGQKFTRDELNER